MANVTINGVTFIPGNGYKNLSLHGQRQFNIYRFVEEDGDRLIFKGVLMPGEKARLFAFPKTHNFVLHDSVDVGDAESKWTKPILEVRDAANAKYLGYFPEQNPTYPYKYTTGGRIWWIGEPPNGDYCKKYHPELYAAYLKKAFKYGSYDSLVQDNVLRDETEYQFLGIHNYGGGSKAFKIKGKGLNEMENLVSLERKLGTQVEHNGFDDTVLVKFDKSNEGKIKRMLGIRDDAQAIILNGSTFDDNIVKDATQLYLKGSMGEYEPVELVSKEGDGAFHKVVIRHKNGKTETTIWNRLTSKHPLDCKTNKVTDDGVSTIRESIKNLEQAIAKEEAKTVTGRNLQYLSALRSALEGAKKAAKEAGIKDSEEDIADGKIVGGEGRSMDGIPWGLYQEGGRSYRGFEITSSENGLRKGVYRFYNWGGGVPFGNSAVDGQFTEAQFQKLIGEGKVKLLDSVSVSDAANTIMVEWQKGDRWNSKSGFGSFEEAASHAKKLKSDPSYHAIAIQVNGYWFTPEGEARSGKSLKEVMWDSERKEQEGKLNDAAVNCNKFEILAKESGANFHNIGNTKKDGVTYMKFVSSAPEAEQERSVKWLRSVLEGQEGSGVLSWGMRGTSRGEMSVMIKDAVTKADLKNKSTAELREILAQGIDEWEETLEERGKTFKAVKAELTKRGVKDSISVGSTVKVPLKNGGSEDAKVVKVSGDIITVKLKGGMEIDVVRSILKDSAKKMFKVVDKATGKTLLVKATDSMAAVKRVSSLKDAEVSTWAYERSHGKQPRGNYGLWMFSSKPNSDDYNNKDIFFEFNGSYANAVAAAKEWAKEKGISTVHVMP